MSSIIPHRLLLVFQLFATIAIIIYVPNSIAQVGLLLFLWLLTFWPLTSTEIIIFIISCIFFTGGDALVIYRNVFQFSHVDIWGMPFYEPFMWGFYFLHSMRMLKTTPSKSYWSGLIFTMMYVLTLSFIQNEVVMLFIVTLLLMGALLFFRTKADFLYTGYLILIGIIIEVLGTYTGVWYYEITHYVWWWIITWGASGLILYRVISPIANLLYNKFIKK